MIKKVTIYGERCTGTNYLENLLTENFDVKITWKYGHKHFFGFNDLSNTDDTLFIGIVRNPFDWLNSLYKSPWHIPKKIRKNITSFLNEEFYSVNDLPEIRPITNKKEIMKDRHIYTKKRYKNIFELRYTKLNFLMNDMPKLVKNYIFIRYEDLLENFENTLNKIRNKDLLVKPTNFPKNIFYYKKNKDKKFNERDKNILIDKTIIKKNENFNTNIEKDLKYI
jgi:hypothetical protein